jgi:FkbM family methyltransferase
MKKWLFNVYQSKLVQKVLAFFQYIVFVLRIDNFLAKYGNNKFAFFLMPFHRLYVNKKPMLWSRNGLNYELDRKDYHQWQIYAQTKEIGQHILSQFFKNGTVFFDCGANVGFISLELAQIAKQRKLENVSIYSFEPNLPIFNALSKNVSLNNGFDSIIHPMNIGLGNEKKIHTFYYNTWSSGASNGFESNEHTVQTTIQINTLDNFMEEMKLDRLDVMKIDIEGFEPFLFLGGEKTISRHKPVILMEINDETQNDPVYGKAFIFDFLRKHGYELFVEEIPGHRIKFDEANYRNEYYHLFDLLAIPKGYSH